jgi:HD-GYP domain-containing protein (c-di-GMP phosphodiesterase class II)
MVGDSRVGEEEPSATDEVTRDEVLAALSFALDLAEGQRPGHATRSCLIALAIADRLAWPADRRDVVLHAGLLKDIGCSSNAARAAHALGTDDRVVKPRLKLTDWTSLPRRAGLAASVVLPDASVPRRLRRLTWLLLAGDIQRELVATRCERGAEIAIALGFGEQIGAAIRGLDEHWDGRGQPYHLRGRQIPLASRALCLAQTFEVFASNRGLDAAWDMLAARRGRWFDPAMVDAVFDRRADKPFWEALIAGELDGSIADASATAAPLPADTAWLDRIADGFAQVIDAKSPYTAMHSRRVAHVADVMGARLGIAGDRRADLRRAALLHDIGKLGLSNRILDKNGPLSPAERGLVRQHPLDTERILGRVRRFRSIAAHAGAHHERLDGSGYPRALHGEDLATESRVLAVADVFEALTARRPYRAAMPVGLALATIGQQQGRKLCPDATEALGAAVSAGEVPISG